MKNFRCISPKKPFFRKSLFLPIPWLPILWLSVLCLFTGCGAFIRAQTEETAENLTSAVMNNNDLETVREGAPAYLLMVDGMLEGDPDNSSLLRSAAGLYSAYTEVFVFDKARAKRLTDKALKYAMKAARLESEKLSDLRGLDFDIFSKRIAQVKRSAVPVLYTLAEAWAGWIQAHRDDWNAVADIARVETTVNRLLALDETYKEGGAHLYAGILSTLLPPSAGGKPEKGRAHFEKAIALSEGKNLYAKVALAKSYARLVFNRPLHDRLLKEVLAADPEIEGYVLMNVLAQKQAKQLLEDAEDFF